MWQSGFRIRGGVPFGFFGIRRRKGLTARFPSTSSFCMSDKHTVRLKEQELASDNGRKKEDMPENLPIFLLFFLPWGATLKKKSMKWWRARIKDPFFLSLQALLVWWHYSLTGARRVLQLLCYALAFSTSSLNNQEIMEMRKKTRNPTSFITSKGDHCSYCWHHSELVWNDRLDSFSSIS